MIKVGRYGLLKINFEKIVLNKIYFVSDTRRCFDPACLCFMACAMAGRFAQHDTWRVVLSTDKKVERVTEPECIDPIEQRRS